MTSGQADDNDNRQTTATTAGLGSAVMSRGLDRLQHHLDRREWPDSWPSDVCTNAWCGSWERNGGAYFWHRAGACVEVDRG